MDDDEWQPTDPVLMACRQLWRAMEDFDDAACRVLSVGRSDLRALNMLEEGPLGAAVLAQQLGLSRGSVTALIDRLEAAGLVTRSVAPHDRRSVLVGLCDQTWQHLADIYRPLGRRVALAAAAHTDRERRMLVRGLQSITAAFDEARPTGDGERR